MDRAPARDTVLTAVPDQDAPDQRVLRHNAPLAYRGLYFRPGDEHIFSHEAIMAPLGADGETADHVIVVAARLFRCWLGIPAG
jgi:hypothetical protein